MNDRAVWAIWYDVDEGDRQRFFQWLHETYLPTLAASKQFAFVANYERYRGPLTASWRLDNEAYERSTTADMKSGTQFVQVIGAASPYPFIKAIEEHDAGRGPKGAGEMLKLRKGVRHEVFLEDERAHGPEGEKGLDASLARCIQFGNYRMKSVAQDLACMSWYPDVCFPALAQAKGSIRTRKLISVAGWAKHGVIYEFDSPEGRNEAFAEVQKLRAADPSKVFSLGPQTIHAPGSAFIGTRTWPG
jgi:hypothetical protein